MALKRLGIKEVEKIRLILSTYQDGSGMLTKKDGSTLPGWRDFERTIALVLNGKAQENKAVFDVLVPIAHKPLAMIGIACKMRGELDRLKRTGRVTVELSNSSGMFWDQLRKNGLTSKTYLKEPELVGRHLLNLVESWHLAVDRRRGGAVELDKSFYLVLSWNRQGWYQLHQFKVALPKPATLKWYFPTKRCLRGDDRTGTLFEWYGESGGQLKYYPLSEKAIWCSSQFQLEPLKNVKGVLAKAAAYFPKAWKRIS